MSEPRTDDEIEAEIDRLAETRLDRAEVEAVLAAFSQRNGLPAMRFDAEGEIGFSFDGELAMRLVHVPSFPGVMAAVPLPAELAGRSDVAGELLQANLSWELNGGGTFGRVSETGAFLFCKLLPLVERDDRVFERDLLAFAARAQDWLEKIELALDLEPEGAAAEAPRPAPTTPISYA